MSKWETIKLGEIVEYGKEKISIDFINHTNYISTENMIENFGGITHASSLPSQKTTSRFQKNDILFSNIRTYFKKVWLAQFDGGCSNDVLVMRPKNNRLDHRYLYYILTSESLTAHSVQTAKGTKMPRGDKQALLNYEVNLPSLSEQKKIADILSTIDDKIALNREINKTLEAMAQAIFKSWFVDFEPFKEGEFVESKLGMIPQGWEVSSIGAETTSVGGATPSTTNPEFWEDGEFYWATPKDLSGLQEKVLIGTERKITNAGVNKISSGQLPVGTVLLSSRAPIGYLAITTMPVSINQGFIAMVCNKRLPHTYVLQWATYKLDDIKQRGSGTTFAEISKSTFRPIQVLVPDKESLQKYDEVVRSYYNQIAINIREAQTLSTLRDTLLPKLLSGEIEV